MYAAHCPRHGKTVLLGLSDIVAITNTATGPIVEWECYCGWRGRTHSSRPPRRPLHSMV
jgi:hypothetical protein